MRGCSGPVCRFSEFRQNLKPYVIARGAEYNQICGSDILEQIAACTYCVFSRLVGRPDMTAVVDWA